ncbi:MAG: CYTH domain-containing protein [Oscillospiraceae bacterium]|nr:CYTH domain-containing protein [Oscillospiraceae bacterium]
MNNVYEIERKFLVELPDISGLSVNKQTDIVQTYLNSADSGSQRRVRKINSDGVIKFTYTEKAFISDVVRKEMEYEINESEYSRLVAEARKDFVPIYKTRYRFEFDNQQFELDVYPFSDKLAILELELENENQKINFPENINVIGEVTGDAKYSNAALALAGAFPEKIYSGME